MYPVIHRTRARIRPLTTFISPEEYQPKSTQKSIFPLVELVAVTAGGLAARLWLSLKEKEVAKETISIGTNGIPKTLTHYPSRHERSNIST
jgi:hypothetical protein